MWIKLPGGCYNNQIGSVTVRSASANRKAFTYNENNTNHNKTKKGDVFMNKKMRLWVAGTVGVLMTGLMSVNAYALEEKDVIGTWYVNELSMGGDILFHPGVMGMEVTVDIKEGGQMETIMSYSGEEPEVNQLEWKIENDKFLMTYDDQTEECEYTDGKITITADGTTMILSREKEEYEQYVPGKPVENPAMEDFKGEWICTLMDAFGMQMPVNSELTGFEMMLSIQEDKSELIIIESGEESKAELQGEMDGNTLILKAAAEDEAGTMLFSCETMRLSLLDDGKLCFEPESDGSEEETSETDGEDFSVKTYFDKIDVVE